MIGNDPNPNRTVLGINVQGYLGLQGIVAHPNRYHQL